MKPDRAEKAQPSAEEKAQSIRQGKELDRETSKNESRLKALARNKLGSQTLLGNGKVSNNQAPKGSSAPKAVMGVKKQSKTSKKSSIASYRSDPNRNASEFGGR
jgi:hypothetical protein